MNPVSRTTTERTVGFSIWTILLFETAALIAREFVRLQLANDGVDHYVAKYLSYLVVPVVLLLLAYPLIRQNSTFFRGLFSGRHLTRYKIVLALCIAMTMWVAGTSWAIAWSALDSMRSNGPTIHALPVYTYTATPLAVTLLGLIVYAVLIPVIEEVINRGVILKILEPRGRLVAIVGSSVLFAIFHAPGGMANAFFFGIVFALLYQNSRTLWLPIGVHSAYNAAVTISNHHSVGTWIGSDSDPRLLTVGIIAMAAWAVSFLLSCLLASRKVIGVQKAPQ